MAQGIYIGVSGKARQVNKIYVGVASKARRVVKAYVGVGGKARLCFFSGVAWHSTVTLSVARNGTTAATVGNYALFAGGSLYDSTAYYSTVNAYDASLTRSTPTALSVKRADMAATTVGNYALFGGGDAYTSSDADTPTRYATVNAYNTSLTRSTPTALSVSTTSPAAAVNQYAIIPAGTLIDTYNTSLTKNSFKNVGDGGPAPYSSATIINKYALFAGWSSNTSNKVDVFISG